MNLNSHELSMLYNRSIQAFKQTNQPMQSNPTTNLHIKFLYICEKSRKSFANLQFFNMGFVVVFFLF